MIRLATGGSAWLATSVAGDFRIRVPRCRPANVRIAHASARAKPAQLHAWWQSTIRTAIDVLWHVRFLRNSLEESATKAAVNAYRLGLRTEMLGVKLLEPRAMTGLNVLDAARRGRRSFQQERRTRDAQLQLEAKRMREKGMSERAIALHLATNARPIKPTAVKAEETIKESAIRKIIRRRRNNLREFSKAPSLVQSGELGS